MSNELKTIDLLADVDVALEQSLRAGDPRGAIQYGRSIMDGVRLSGIALAKLLYRLRNSWDTFIDNGIDDDFYSVMESEMGVPVSTAKKYADAWEAIFENSNLSVDIKERLLTKPMRILLLLPALAGEEDVDWDAVINARDKNEVRDIVRGVRGAVTSSKTALYIKIDIRTGQLTAVCGDGIREPFGMLAVDKGKTNEVVAHAINRIIQDAGIQVT